MAEVKWIKLNIDMFDNKKIKQIRKMPEGNNIVLIWVMLLTMAGRCNAGGMIFLTENILYNAKTLSYELDFEESVVQMALDILVTFGMISTEDGIEISNWEEYQNVESMERIREQNKIRKRNERARKALGMKSDKEMSRDCHVTSHQCHATDIDKDKEEDIDINRNIDINNNLLRSTDVQKVVDAWNSLPTTITKIKAIKPNTERYRNLKARVNDYGLESVLESIENIKKSNFLCNGSSTGWKLDFSWFVLPNNFIKVLEGKYTDKISQPSIVGTREEVEDDTPGIDLWGDDDETVIDYSLENNKI